MGKTWVDPNKLCMGCMEVMEKDYGCCPKCGFSLAYYRRPAHSLPACEIINGKYVLGKVIGIGGFGINYIAWDLFHAKRVCIKEYFPKAVATRNTTGHSYTEQLSVSLQMTSQLKNYSRQQIEEAYTVGLKNYVKEAEILSKFYRTPGIVSVRDFFCSNNTAYIVMEYIDGVDMKNYASANGGRLSWEETLGLLQEVLKTLHQVHQFGIIHRDISPDNIMINRDYHAKLIDFGAAKDYVKHSNVPLQLKQGYAPIEQYSKDGVQGPWTDVYSMSASIYFLISGKKIPKAYERVQRDTLMPLIDLGIRIPEEISLSIQKGMAVEAKDRYSSIADLYQSIYGEKI